MLKRLRIQNLALLDEVDIEFRPGLNVITGETGAGKSILVGAISLALGDRAHPEAVDEEKALVEAFFENEERSRILKREVRPDGRTRAWIDGSPTTIGALKLEGEGWVDLTAQREGITLLDTVTHVRHLDRFAGLTLHTERVESYFSRYEKLNDEIKAVEAKIARMRETDELAEFQLDEISKFDPQPGQDEELDVEIRRLEGAESLLQGLGSSIAALDEDDMCIADTLADIVDEVRRLRQIEPELELPLSLLNHALDSIRDAAREMTTVRGFVFLDPERLEDLRVRRMQLSRLIRKYGGSMQSLLETYNKLKSRESGIEILEDQRRALQQMQNKLLLEWEEMLHGLSDQRKEAAPRLEKAMVDGLKSVGIKHPRFELRWAEPDGVTVEFPERGNTKVAPWGWDQPEFFISFNPGHDLKPVHKVASGGELSRMMLLLKGFQSDRSMAPVLVFDEVDAGISGRTARQVGLRLRELARSRQVLLVTHLAQIASLADVHWVVDKLVEEDLTRVNLRHVEIGGPEQVEEVARIVGGETITKSARETARELIAHKDAQLEL
ncbi:AAA family ATPase, partial [bacterium]|nr:AAA family ATPase [bacterium]